VTGDGVPPDDDQPTSTSLLERAKSQDEKAWEQLVELYSPLVYAWCRKAGLQPADAADVGQEVFRAVARKLGDFHRDREGDTFRGWLRTITRNKLRDLAADLRRSPAGFGGIDGSNELDRFSDESLDTEADLASDRQIVYQRALEVIRTAFEERTWRMFWLVVIEDKPAEDVARELQVTVNAVYLAKSRVLRRLRDEFADVIEDLPDPDHHEAS
jgi:RNA polymerase sigma-70 factor (ECF subfamily)